MHRIRDGFAGQKLIVLPGDTIKTLATHPVTASLYLTHIGFFPRARYHYVERCSGAAQHILIYCTGGKGWYQYSGRRVEIAANEFFSLPAGQSHRYGAHPKDPWTIYFIHFAGERSAFFLTDTVTGRGEKAVVPGIPERLQYIDEILHALELGYAVDNLCYVNTFLWHLLGSFFYPRQFMRSRYLIAPTPAEAAIHFMQANLKRSMALTAMAEHANLSPSHFSAVFKKETGYSPIDYFNRLKIQKACQYLDLSDLRIKEISTNLGFDDPHYFSRLFTAVMGEPPTEYRKRKNGVALPSQSARNRQANL
jgi:AraC-like DNA-binding protein